MVCFRYISVNTLLKMISKVIIIIIIIQKTAYWALHTYFGTY